MITFKNDLPFASRKKTNHIALVLITDKTKKSWLKNKSKQQKEILNQRNIEKTSQTALSIFDSNGNLEEIAILITSATSALYDYCATIQKISGLLNNDTLKNTTFALNNTEDLKQEQIDTFCQAWGLCAYKHTSYKTSDQQHSPILVWPKKANKKEIEHELNAIYTLRNLVNTPSNDMGPDELESIVKSIATTFEAKTKIIKDEQLLKQNFPLIYTVGKASPRRPRLIELNWGNPKHPKLTLVGKGVAFDTGGLNLKPGGSMRHMKKDMGGAAHTIALAYLIMANNLPVSLQLLVPAVENAVAGEAFRPGDIIKSRKGITVENTNTDAEGRLILADSLTYACERTPELVIDFATLTGSARAALGPDIPAFFSTSEKHARNLQKLSIDIDDPVWNMPLWDKYKKHIESPDADIHNSAGLPGDLIYSALFLKQFINTNLQTADKKQKTKIDWMHFDCFAWEQGGKAGRPKGGADTGLRSVYSFLKDIYKK